jgi:phosphopentomutase
MNGEFMKNKTPIALVMVIDAVGLSTIEYLLKNYDKEIKMPNLSRLGLGRIVASEFEKRFALSGAALSSDGSFKNINMNYAARINQVSATADSLVGHREMMGILDDRTYDLFYDGFSQEYLKELEKRTGHKTFFNKMAGGVEAIELNAEEHEKTGNLIVYASKCDPLVQIAMNEAIIPVEEQHKIADIAFNLAMEMKIPITRAIARSYIKNSEGEIMRTSNRHDSVLPIGGETLIDIMNKKNIWTIAVGKTSDLVNTHYQEKIKLKEEDFIDPSLDLRYVHPKKKDTNLFSVQGIINAISSSKNVYRPHGTFIFANLVDTDSLYGHTRDIEGAIKSIEEIDRIIPLIENCLGEGDIFMITADHGMEHKDDYGYHSNEPLPLIVERRGFDCNLGGIKTGAVKGLMEVGHIAAQLLGCEEEYLNLPGIATSAEKTLKK